MIRFLQTKSGAIKICRGCHTKVHTADWIPNVAPHVNRKPRKYYIRPNELNKDIQRYANQDKLLKRIQRDIDREMEPDRIHVNVKKSNQKRNKYLKQFGRYAEWYDHNETTAKKVKSAESSNG